MDQEHGVVFVVDLDARRPEVRILEGSALKNSLNNAKTKNPLDLEDWSFRVFEREDSADLFMRQFEHVAESLSKNRRANSKERGLPIIKLYRKYLILSLLGVKTYTTRDRDRGLKRGDRINLSDQTFFVTVEVTRVENLPDGKYRYHYRLV